RFRRHRRSASGLDGTSDSPGLENRVHPSRFAGPLNVQRTCRFDRCLEFPLEYPSFIRFSGHSLPQLSGRWRCDAPMVHGFGASRPDLRLMPGIILTVIDIARIFGDVPESNIEVAEVVLTRPEPERPPCRLETIFPQI